MTDLKTIIEAAFEERMSITPTTVSAEIKNAVQAAIALLDSGQARVAELCSRRRWSRHHAPSARAIGARCGKRSGGAGAKRLVQARIGG